MMDKVCINIHIYILYAHIYSFKVLDNMSIQEYRQQAIRELLHSGFAATQKSLVDELKNRGYEATQSSVSRDLKDIGAFKTVDGYTMEFERESDSEDTYNISHLITSVATAGPNLMVIRTKIGAAQQVALFLDKYSNSGIVGNIGGDDTVFTVTSDKAHQRILGDKINHLISRS